MVLTQEDLDEIEDRLKEVFVIKEDFTEYKSELFDKFDEIVKKNIKHKPGRGAD